MAAEFKKQFSQNFTSLELPPPLNHVTPEALVAAVRRGAGAPDVTRVIDVRPADEFAKGHIRGSENVPLDALLDPTSAATRELVQSAEAAFAKGQTISIVFVSLQSPDVDEAGAMGFIKAWDELASQPGPEAAARPSGATFSFILLGGVFYFLQLYRQDAQLVESYDAATWDSLLAKDAASSE